MTRATFSRRLVATAVLLCAGVLLRAEQRVTQPYSGISRVDSNEAAPRAVHMHIVQIDLRAPGPRRRPRHFFASFFMYASSLSFSYFTVLRNRLSARYVRRSASSICSMRW